MFDYLNTVRTCFDNAGARHFEIVGTSVRLASRADASDERSTADAYAEFAALQDGLPPGSHYTVSFWANSNGKKAAQKYTFFKPYPPQGAAGIGSIDSDLQTRVFQMEKMLERERLEAQHREEIRKLKEENESSLNIDKVTALFGNISGLFDKAIAVQKAIAAPQAIASPGPVQAPAAQPVAANPDSDRLASSLQALAEVMGDAELVNKLEFLASKALEDPAGFRGKMSFLPNVF